MIERWNNTSVRELEHQSIRAFVQLNAAAFRDVDVLDFGCGQAPYREIVEEAGGRWHGHDAPYYPGSVVDHHVTEGEPPSWGAVLCTQVIQYVSNPAGMLEHFRIILDEGGALVLTGPTNWAEVEPEDLHRFTLAGARRLVESAGFHVKWAEQRAVIDLGGFRLSLGYGIVAVA